MCCVVFCATDKLTVVDSETAYRSRSPSPGVQDACRTPAGSEGLARGATRWRFPTTLGTAGEGGGGASVTLSLRGLWWWWVGGLTSAALDELGPLVGSAEGRHADLVEAAGGQRGQAVAPHLAGQRHRGDDPGIVEEQRDLREEGEEEAEPGRGWGQ